MDVVQSQRASEGLRGRRRASEGLRGSRRASGVLRGRRRASLGLRARRMASGGHQRASRACGGVGRCRRALRGWRMGLIMMIVYVWFHTEDESEKHVSRSCMSADSIFLTISPSRSFFLCLCLSVFLYFSSTFFSLPHSLSLPHVLSFSLSLSLPL